MLYHRTRKKPQELLSGINVSYADRQGNIQRHDLFHGDYLQTCLFGHHVLDKTMFMNALITNYTSPVRIQAFHIVRPLFNKGWRKYKRLARKYSHRKE